MLEALPALQISVSFSIHLRRPRRQALAYDRRLPFRQEALQARRRPHLEEARQMIQDLEHPWEGVEYLHKFKIKIVGDRYKDQAIFG